ncbi:hypothetical protein E0Z10_g9884 [Xylaria hypoxylon]|uniref:Carrier domain-containing protein n=1 Tax=Xylaria hypoxylon TaxID=37992 RepID=A0A4Z0Y530_9PEZI|nr:hypothetical protein E0Z10_g9884 [Xylaria hypoxylon]
MVNWYGVRIYAEDEWLNTFVIDPESAPDTIDKSCDGIVKVLTTGTKEEYGGKVVLYKAKFKPTKSTASVDRFRGTESRTTEHLQQPEFSQPLVTALQLAILAVLESWGIKATRVVGHSSGEIAAAGKLPEYEILLAHVSFSSADGLAQEVEMFSSVTALRMTGITDALYWKKNMISPVRFDEALTALVSGSPALPSIQLDSHVTYLIVGGLKGLCGSLAINMAYHGACHIIACSRSGLSDKELAAIVYNCGALGCKITEARGDVSDGKFVQRIFKSAHSRIAGLIQGAMVLRDRPYETMTVEEYHAAMEAKVQGTWNLHRASQEVRAQKQPLDFFTMLLSSLGLTANTVDLDAIQDVGSAQLITGIAYPLQASSSDLDDDPRFGYHFGGSDGDDDAAQDEGGTTDEASLTKTAAALLGTQITRLLHLETEVETGKPLAAYGLDSLSAVEMRGWVRNKLGAELS